MAELDAQLARQRRELEEAQSAQARREAQLSNEFREASLQRNREILDQLAAERREIMGAVDAKIRTTDEHVKARFDMARAEMASLNEIIANNTAPQVVIERAMVTWNSFNQTLLNIESQDSVPAAMMTDLAGLGEQTRDIVLASTRTDIMLDSADRLPEPAATPETQVEVDDLPAFRPSSPSQFMNEEELLSHACPSTRRGDE